MTGIGIRISEQVAAHNISIAEFHSGTVKLG